MTTEPTRLADLAARLGRVVEGDGDFQVRGVAPLESAGPGDLAFVSSNAWARGLRDSKAGAVILPDGIDSGGRPAIRSPNPRLDFVRTTGWLHPDRHPGRGVDPSAILAPDAAVHPEAWVGPRVVVGARSSIGARSVVHANTVLYPDVRVGADCLLHAGCIVREGTELGDRVILQPGAVLGSDGFGYHPDESGEFVKIPHLGRVVVGDDVEIGANAAVDRGTLGETRIGRGAKIDNLVVIAHNCQIGEDVIIVAQSGLAGSTVVGRRAVLMAQIGAAGHLRIGEGAFLGARAGVHKDVPAGSRVYGTPQMPERTWHRAMAALARLPDALRRLRAVERRLGIRKPRE